MIGLIRAFATSAVNPWWLLAIVLAVTGAGGWGYLEGRQAGANAVLAKVATREDTVARTQAIAMQAAARAIADIQVKSTVIRQAVEREIVERPVYRDCVHSDGQLQRINAAIVGSEWAEPAHPIALPAPDAAH